MKRLLEMLCSFGGGGTVGSAGGKDAKRHRCKAIIKNNLCCNFTKITVNENSLSSCPPNFCSSDSTPPRPSPSREGEENTLSLWEREQLCEQVEHTTAGEGHPSSGTMCHLLPHRGEGLKELLKHRGQSDVQEILKQVQDDENNFLKRTYSPIHLFPYSPRKRPAFTLAEVLITLGIIGVVAAMTMPTLVSHYRHKVLETQFKKAYSTLSQAVIPIQTQLLSCPSGNKNDIRELLFEQFKKIDVNKNSKRYNNKFKTYTKKETSALIHANCLDPSVQPAFTGFETIVADGVTIAFCTNNSYGNMISIDTNGFEKGPNAFGHDLFFFHLNLNNCNLEPMTAQWRTCTEDDTDCAGASDDNLGFKWTDGNCSKNSDTPENGFACTQYAIANTCPDDPGKGYFDCLP